MSVKEQLLLYPFLKVVICFGFGIWLGNFLFPIVPTWIWILVAFAVLFVWVVIRKHRFLKSILLLLVSFVLGVGWISIHRLKQVKQITSVEQTYDAMLLSDPIRHGKVVQTRLLVLNGRLKNEEVQASILRDKIENAYKILQVGNIIRCNSVVQSLESENIFIPPYYKKYLQSKGVVATTFIYYDDWCLSSASLKELSWINQLRIKALLLRKETLKMYEKQETTSDIISVLDAMTLGEKGYLSNETRNIYSASGASHLLALSGLHLGILFLLCATFIKRLKNAIVEGALELTLIWGYVFVTGMSITILRAAIMLSLYILANVMKRKPLMLNSLCLTIFILLISNPFSLWDVGFQLSSVAVLSVFIFYKPINNFFLSFRLMKGWLQRKIISVISASLAAQIGVTPLIMHYFGTFPVYFFMTNLIAIPLSTIILYGSVLLYIANALPVVQLLLLKGEFMLTHILNLFLRYISTLPMAQVSHINFSFIHILLYYIIVFCISKIIHYAIKVDRSLVNHL